MNGWVEIDFFDCIFKCGKINYFNRVRSFYIIDISKNVKWIANDNMNPKFLKDFSFQTINGGFSEINMSARQFKDSWQELFSTCTFRYKQFFDAIEIMMDKSVSSYHLLAFGWFFAFVRCCIHIFLFSMTSLILFP